MSVIRRLASRILLLVVRRFPQESRSWGDAMLREMDFVDSDWAALGWALGSTTALCRQLVIHRLREWRSRAARAGWMTAVLSGMAMAGVVWSISVLALSGLMRTAWIAPNKDQLAERLFVVIIPEVVYLLVAFALWRLQRRVAVGVLAAGAILIAHAIVHVATYG